MLLSSASDKVKSFFPAKTEITANITNTSTRTGILFFLSISVFLRSGDISQAIPPKSKQTNAGKANGIKAGMKASITDAILSPLLF